MVFFRRKETKRLSGKVKHCGAASLIIILILSISPSEAAENVISLKGLHKFSPGDDIQWASPQYNDAHWQRIRVPGSWQAQGVRGENGMGWYRIRFALSEGLQGRPLGVSLGFIGNADETFLNGVKIGNEGRVGRRFIEATLVERLYRIPAGVLNFEEDNLLAVRVMHMYRNGGIFKGKIALGDHHALLIEKLNRDFARKAEEIGIFSITFIFFVSCLLIYFAGIREKEYIYFSGLVLICLLCLMLDSLWFYETGFKKSLVQQSMGFLYGLLPVSMLGFVIQFFTYRFTRPLQWLLWYSIIVSLLLLLFGNLSYRTYYFLVYLWAVEVLLIGAAGLAISLNAYRTKRPESGPVFLGVIGLVFSGFLEILNSIGIIWTEKNYIDYYLYLFFIMCVVYALVIRFLRFRSRSKTLSGRILTAHEEERRRLARELHDGLGQGLLALKFNLQLFNRQRRSDQLNTVIDVLSGNIDDLRDISMGLSPPFLEDLGLGAALSTYGRQFSEKTGIHVAVRSDDHHRYSQVIRENLFRIFQEALANAAKHSGAASITVSLENAVNRAILEIADDGCGFDYDAKRAEGGGLGLSTLRERVTLMDGVLDIKTRPGRGTRLRIEVPLT